MSNERENPKTLYYYCTLETFANIVQNKKIWLNDIAKTNDYQEQRYLARLISDEYIKITQQTLDPISAEILKLKLREWLENRKIFPVWAICLSALKDNLSQWRGYADDGKGISIGFNFEYLRTVEELHFDKACDQNNNFFCLDKINYYPETIAREMLMQCLRNGESIGERLKKVLDTLCFTFDRPFYKNNAFQVEDEWRIVYSTIDHTKPRTLLWSELVNFSNSPNGKFKERFEVVDELKFTMRNGKIVSHLELEIKDMTSAIDNIYIGPKSSVTVDDVRNYLAALCIKGSGVNIDKLLRQKDFVCKSSASYR